MIINLYPLHEANAVYALCMQHGSRTLSPGEDSNRAKSVYTAVRLETESRG